MERPASVWRNRDFVLLVGGTTVNGVGDWLLELALPLYVFIETGSGIATAAVYIINLVVGVVVGPLGGSLVDRWRLRATLVGTNLLQLLALGPLLLVSSDRIWPVYVVAVLQGLISTVNDPAGFAVLPRLVADEQLVAANSALSAGGSIARLLGAAAGGVAIAVGGMPVVVAADASTFVVGAVAAWLLSPAADRGRSPDGASTPADSSVRAGLREVRSRPSVVALIGIRSLAMFGFGAFPILFIVFITEYLDGGGTEVGVIRASSAFGGLVAAAVIGRFASRHHPARVMVGGYLSFALVAFLFVNAPPITTALWVYLVLFALSGLPNVASQVGSNSTAQLLCPPEVLGRLGGLMSAAGALGMGAGSLAAGLLLETFTARVLFNGQVVALVLCGLIGYWFVTRPLDRAPSARRSGANGHVEQPEVR